MFVLSLNTLKGVFRMAQLEKTFDFNMMDSYKEFGALDIISLYKWSNNKWTGEARDGNLIAISSAMGSLQMSRSSTYYGLENAKFSLVGVMKSKKSIISTSSMLSAKDICEYMRWNVSDEYVMDFIS